MEKVSIIGLDLAKRSVQAHGARAEGGVAFRKKLSREKVLTFLAEQPRCVVAMEACGSAHHWGRTIRDLGHEVRLIPPAYVKPFVKRQKNDAADAEAIVEAASRPTMRFVAVKTEEQQARAMLFRTRDLLVRQRTQLINALRGHLSEHGVVAAQGPANVKVLEEAVEDQGTSLPLLVVELARVFLDQIEGLSERISGTRESDGSRSGMRRNDTASADHAWRRPHHGLGDRDLRATDGCLQMWARFRRLARARAPATFDRGQTGSRESLEDGAARYSSPVDHWRDGRRSLGLAERLPGGKLATAHASAQAKDAGGDCAGQQDGPVNLGHAGEGRGLSGSYGCGSLIEDRKPWLGKRQAREEVDER